MTDKNKTEETSVTEQNKKKGRLIKVIFTPLSVLFYAGVGYLIYRRLRRQQDAPIIVTA
ncbi:hypothetical protein G4Y79_14390 [Phototrophicus methaneseepsis]|uniref:Uncharacterized protein n=1 Tax=Phototrophicus methaneseepsis TaxID=2710758 RepID=A0A7S8E5S1_9CHLR|nr:hypothetical protein [Phototrophicus methaneseepsis]QPC80897.1 hypothetical protein G4Y79_14390 [Phototrophicus methaneseepsis]